MRNKILTVIITAAFVVAGITIYKTAYLRLYEALTGFIGTCGLVLGEITGKDVTAQRIVTDPSSVLGEAFSFGGEQTLARARDYFGLLVSGENLAAFFAAFMRVMFKIVMWTAALLPVLFILVKLVKAIYGKRNVKHNKDTVPLRIFKRVASVTYVPMKNRIKDYSEYLKRHVGIKVFWVILWLVQFNIASVIVELVSYALYFVVTFDLSSLYGAVGKLVMDLLLALRYAWWALIVFVPAAFCAFRKRIALSRLRHYEARNCGFINDLPIVTMTCGSMGKKKTTAITDMALSQEVMFRQKALEIIERNDMKFPHFPWIYFEDELCACMEHHTVYSLALVKAWVEKKRERYICHGNAKLQLYGYDVKRYGFTYDDALKTSTLFDVMKTYAQAYFIYTVESSLILSNYSIRTDNELVSEGNFPLWLTDFFTAKSGESERHSHILDFDVLRLGRKVLENNPRAGSFEFGVVAISEIGKERGNNLELQEKKKSDDETNQKNDLFNAWLKMCRHSATVDNFPFIKIFTDEQRPESWGADARDLCYILRIEDAGERRLALPFYTIEEMLSEWAFNKFISLYYDFRFRRGDNTLLVHILKSITARIWHRHVGMYDRYGYSVLTVSVERGTMDGKRARKKYFLMDRKIYSRRFSTDCFSDYFNDLAKRSNVGLNDYLEYATEKASVAELKEQNSYFVNALYKEE